MKDYKKSFLSIPFETPENFRNAKKEHDLFLKGFFKVRNVHPMLRSAIRRKAPGNYKKFETSPNQIRPNSEPEEEITEFIDLLKAQQDRNQKLGIHSNSRPLSRTGSKCNSPINRYSSRYSEPPTGKNRQREAAQEARRNEAIKGND